MRETGRDVELPVVVFAEIEAFELAVGVRTLAHVNDDVPDFSAQHGHELAHLRITVQAPDHVLRRKRNAVLNERIGQAEQLKEYGLRRVLEDILIQEEEHKRDISNAIAK